MNNNEENNLFNNNLNNQNTNQGVNSQSIDNNSFQQTNNTYQGNANSLQQSVPVQPFNNQQVQPMMQPINNSFVTENVNPNNLQPQTNKTNKKTMIIIIIIGILLLGTVIFVLLNKNNSSSEPENNNQSTQTDVTKKEENNNVNNSTSDNNIVVPFGEYATIIDNIKIKLLDMMYTSNVSNNVRAGIKVHIKNDSENTWTIGECANCDVDKRLEIKMFLNKIYYEKDGESKFGFANLSIMGPYWDHTYEEYDYVIINPGREGDFYLDFTIMEDRETFDLNFLKEFELAYHDENYKEHKIIMKLPENPSSLLKESAES